MNEEIAVSACNLSKCYRLYDRPQDRLKQSLFARFGRNYAREFWALHNVSFEVRRGETLGIIGQNGSGKSTLLQMLAGTLQPTEGNVRVNGRVAALLELGAGFNPEFTGRENVLLNGAIMGISEAEMRERFDEIAAFAQIGNFMDQPVKTYSSGMFVRLAFAVAVCVDPDILIVDEALAVGDSLYQSRCYRRMEKMRERGKTIILVTHDYITVQSFCNRAILLDAGKLLKIGDSKSVVNRYIELIVTREQEYVKWLEGKQPIQSSGDLSRHMAVHEQQETERKEFRFGSRDADIVDYYLLDEEGKRTTVLQSGMLATIVVITQFHKSIKRPIIGFIVHTPTGINVFGTNSWYAENEPGPQDAGARLLTQFSQRILLTPGNYVLSLAVADRSTDSMTYLDDRMDVMSFRVTGPKSLHAGVVDLGTEIRYSIVTSP